jgi:hypothetical protein
MYASSGGIWTGFGVTGISGWLVRRSLQSFLLERGLHKALLLQVVHLVGVLHLPPPLAGPWGCHPVGVLGQMVSEGCVLGGEGGLCVWHSVQVI